MFNTYNIILSAWFVNLAHQFFYARVYVIIIIYKVNSITILGRKISSPPLFLRDNIYNLPFHFSYFFIY